MGRVIYPTRFAGFLFLGGGISLILSLTTLYIVVGVFLVVIGYRLTGLSVWNFIFKSWRDKSISETAFEEVEKSAKKAEEIRALLDKETREGK